MSKVAQNIRRKAIFFVLVFGEVAQKNRGAVTRFVPVFG